VWDFLWGEVCRGSRRSIILAHIADLGLRITAASWEKDVHQRSLHVAMVEKRISSFLPVSDVNAETKDLVTRNLVLAARIDLALFQGLSS